MNISQAMTVTVSVGRNDAAPFEEDFLFEFLAWDSFAGTATTDDKGNGPLMPEAKASQLYSRSRMQSDHLPHI